MTTNKLDIIFLIDYSTTEQNVLAGIIESIKQIGSDIGQRIGRFCIMSFDNIGKVRKDWTDFALFDEVINEFRTDEVDGGMSNVHRALKMTTGKVEETADSNTACILLFQTSDPTDTIRQLDDDDKSILADAEKYLIKRVSSLTEPKGFDGCRKYTQGNEQDLILLTHDLQALCRDTESMDDKEDRMAIPETAFPDITPDLPEESDNTDKEITESPEIYN